MNIISLLIPKEISAFVYEDCTLRQGLEKMRAHGYTAIPVLSRDGKYVGTVSEGDFLWNILDNQNNSIRDKEKLCIADIIRKDFNPSVNVYISVEELLRCAVNQSFIPVVDDRDYFIGIVTRQKIILTLMKKMEQESN